MKKRTISANIKSDVKPGEKMPAAFKKKECSLMNRNERNLSMLTDFYELTMMNGYLEKGMEDTVAVFDVFFRRIRAIRFAFVAIRLWWLAIRRVTVSTSCA